METAIQLLATAALPFIFYRLGRGTSAMNRWKRAGLWAGAITIALIAVGAGILANQRAQGEQARLQKTLSDMRAAQEKEADKRQGVEANVKRLQVEIAQRLEIGDALQREIYTFSPHSFNLAEIKVDAWRKEAIRFLSEELYGSAAKDRFQQASLVYPHRDRLEWVQVWLAELRNRLWEIHANVDMFVDAAESAQKTGSIPSSKID